MNPTHRHALKRRIRDEIRRCHPRHALANALTWGVALVAVGAWWLWRGPQAWFWDHESWATLVPALIAWSGLVLAAVVRTPWALVTGLQRLAIGAWLYVGLHGLWGWTLGQTWPVALVIAGLAIVARGLLEPWDDGPDAAEPPAPPPAPPTPSTSTTSTTYQESAP